MHCLTRTISLVVYLAVLAMPYVYAQTSDGSDLFVVILNDKRGYINRLDFKVAGVTARIEDHPQHQDIIKLILPLPLAPKNSINIETPFHVKLPDNFSRSGYIKQSYQITQWYPKPAVYDKKRLARNALPRSGRILQ